MDGTKTTKIGGMTHMPRVSTTVVLFNKIRVVLWIRGALKTKMIHLWVFSWFSQ
jgi:hypothetical protein